METLSLLWRIFPLFILLISVLIFYANTNTSKPSRGDCSLFPHDNFWVASKRIVTPRGIISGAVEVKGENIISKITGGNWRQKINSAQIVDYGEAVVMPGLIDVHAHLDDPGRTEWEGFPSGTKAAAAGGITTLIDMPLNSFPSTVSEETLQLKLKAAKENLHVDVGFWGGLVPENAFNASALDGLLRAGVLGLKSFMCPSGINDFPMTNVSHIKEGLAALAKYRRPLLVHAEIQPDSEIYLDPNDDPRSYLTYLKTRPPSMEQAAIRELLTVTQDTRTGGPADGAHLHIVHLSDATSSLDLIKEAKSRGDRISVETCPHYLAFSAEEISDGDTRFKCAPPIRDSANKEKLWKALLEGDIDMLSSDHSPSEPELKLLEEGNFLRAWGGISSLQFVLPVTWSHGRNYGATLEQLALWWSEKPAKLTGQSLHSVYFINLGAIAIGNHADIVVWEPELEFDLNGSHPIYHKHPCISAYMGKTLSGKVLASFVRGNLVYEDGKHASAACAQLRFQNSRHRRRYQQSFKTKPLKTLEWDSICRQPSSFAFTTMGFSAAKSAKIPIERKQTSAAKSLLPFKLDFSGIVDASEIVDSSLVSVRELCLVKRTLKSAIGLLEQLKEVVFFVGSITKLQFPFRIGAKD
ncbi:Amidohydrolase-related [Dillenia turbinata]|uniref:allantoinase n=2 Tax=Magnoliopsida TaxID=3398 RepID=A0AAN8YZ56_9MAGN